MFGERLLNKCPYKPIALVEAPTKDFFLQPEPFTTVEISQPEAQAEDLPENWGKAIKELEIFFAAVELPTQPIKLNKCSTITDCSQLIENHLAIVKANEGEKVFEPYLIRLKEVRNYLAKGNKRAFKKQ